MLIRFFLFLLIVALFFTLAKPGNAFGDNAEDRMAGSNHISDESVRNKNEPVPESASSATSEEKIESQNTLKVDFTALESQGLLTTESEGSLGRDLWHGSKRSLIRTYLPQIPAMAQYRTLQILTKRLLLTKADSSLVDSDEKLLSGYDLTTLRIEKLMEMGLYKEAFALYSKQQDEPYHEHLARAGILAAFYNKESALGCLELKSLQNRFGDVVFWQHMTKICAYIMSKTAGKSDRLATLNIDFSDDTILRSIVEKENYHFKPRKIEDFQKLTSLQMAALTATGRLDLGTLKLPAAQDNSSLLALALFLEEPTLPEDQEFLLMIKAVNAGLKTTENLTFFYEDKAEKHFGKNKKGTSLAGYRAIKEWERLPYLHRAASNAARGDEQAAIMHEVFALAHEYGTTSLWPFARIIASLDPEILKAQDVKIAFKILGESGESLSEIWRDRWNKHQNHFSQMDKSAFLQLVAYEIGTFSTKKDYTEDPDFIESFLKLGLQEQEIIKIAYEKLDKNLKLHNYNVNGVYEKDIPLTSSSDYVMPNTGLLDHLEKAKKEQRPGEIVLLSSIIFRDIPPDKIYPGLFREVIDGLIAVGLTNEARSLAREVMLGMNVNQKEN
ncbi:MAG: hypothetical protein CO093_05915 [Alphaproteobacteria bacterium CG_4_9_14_3_um_filter_47_13]|nr:MAG: hypothetical protein CO093_05915 [Alphaproteobacteria bacterium CG_4_9_14_3_um_filter_47_13]